jgi:hypothetical protein
MKPICSVKKRKKAMDTVRNTTEKAMIMGTENTMIMGIKKMSITMLIEILMDITKLRYY